MAWSIEGKTALVTGANSGIGLQTARALADQGAEVILLCRSRQRGEQARREIIQATGNEAVELVLADFAELDQVRAAAATVRGRWDELHVLVNNAGAVLGERTITPDGNEMQVQVNHLAPFLLTHELSPLLLEGQPARIVNVASEAHWNAKTLPDGFQSLEGRYRSFTVYSQTKLYNILFTKALDRRLQGTELTANCLHPGVIGSRFGSQGPWYVRAFMAVARPLLTSPEKGAATSVHLATSPAVQGISGTYFKNEAPADCSRLARDKQVQEELWEASAQLTGAKDWQARLDTRT